MTRKRSTGYRTNKEKDKLRQKIKRDRHSQDNDVKNLSAISVPEESSPTISSNAIPEFSVSSQNVPSHHSSQSCQTTTLSSSSNPGSEKPVSQSSVFSPVTPSVPAYPAQIILEPAQPVPAVMGVHEYSYQGIGAQDVLTGDLSIQVLDFVTQCLSKQFPLSYGLLSPSFLYSLEKAKQNNPNIKLPKEVRAVQIHFVYNHYLVSAQINGHLHVFDSMYNVLHLQALKPQLRLLYTDMDIRNVNYSVPQSQGCTNLCGFFAIANTLTLLENRLPGYTKFDLNKMRHHLFDCLQNGLITAFPSSSLHFLKLGNVSQGKSNVKSHNTDEQLQSQNLTKRGENDKMRKKEQRKDAHFKKSEKLQQKKYRQNIRNQTPKRTDEQEKDKCYRQKKRQDTQTRILEREKEKLYRQKVRRESAKRADEQEKDKCYRQKKRQDTQIRTLEREKEKLYRQKIRRESAKRADEQEKDKCYRHKKRQDTQTRLLEREKEKLYRQKVRRESTKRADEQGKDKCYRQKKRQDTQTRTLEREKEKSYRHKKRQDADIRIPEKGKQKKYKQKIRQDKNRRDKEQKKDKEYKQNIRQNKDTRKKQNQNQKKTREKKQELFKDIHNVINLFHMECKEIPSFVCAVCFRLLFRKQVKSFLSSKYSNTELITHYIDVNNLHMSSHSCELNCSTCARWICFTCDKYLLADKIPNQAAANNLHLPLLPDCLRNLNQLEKHLVSPVIPFMKILPLPKGQQKGVHGPVVCVPSDMSSVTQILPRHVSDDTLVKVKLKRKLQYKGHHLFQQVSLYRLMTALNHLKTVNPHFSDITLDIGNIDINEEPGLIIPDTDGNTSTPFFEHGNPDRTDEAVSQCTSTSVSTDSGLEKEAATLLEENQGSTSDLTETSAPMVSCLQQECPEQHISLAPAEGQKPCSALEMETKAFPYLFPGGENGYSQPRDTRIGLSRYFNNRLFSKDIRFASDPQYIFFSQFVTERNSINSSVSIAIRKGAKQVSGKEKITASMITDQTQRKRILSSDKGYHFLRAVRGSPAYWEKVLRDLLATVKQLGIPTWFCSFSAADRRWPEIVDAICQQQEKPVPDYLDWSQYCQLINSNPVTACRMFEHRVNAFISTVIMSEAKPIGDVVDFFIRTEFQSRGWPHIHCLFWCADAPPFQKNDPNNQAFIDFVDTYVSCALPDEKEDPVLYELVTSVQLHSKNHSRSCKKGLKACRYNFPRPISTDTFIAVPTPPPEHVLPTTYKSNATNILKTVWDAIDTVQEQEITTDQLFQALSISQNMYQDAHSALASRNTVIFKRGITDIWVNPYNEHLLRAWNGNIDIQPVLDPYSCIMYIVSYISKAERELGDVLRKAQEEAEEGNTDPITQLRTLGNIYINARELSIMEAVYRVCGMNLKHSSREVVFVPSDPNSARITKPIQVLEQSDPTNDNIWMTNIIDRYLSRPKTPEFELMTLAHFASHFKVKDRTTKNNEDNDEQEETDQYKQVYPLQNKMGSVVVRKTPAIIRYPNYNRDKQTENYYYNLIAMYYPYRCEDFKPSYIDTYEQMFHQFSNIILPNMEQFEQLSDELDEAWQLLQNSEPQEDVWAHIASNQEVGRIEDQEDLSATLQEILRNSHEIEPSDIPDINLDNTNTATQCANDTVHSIPRTTKKEHLDRVRTLNQNQSQLFHFIKNWAERREHQHADPFYIFLMGGAGTGKSHTIKCIFNEVDRTLSRQSNNADSPVILLVAYTGTAAFNIDGQTIHSAFTVNKNMSTQLTEESANTLRTRLQDLQLLIIDEVSMVSTRLLNIIHCRLQQIMKPSKPNSFFGNVSVLAVGDFHQIPPISGKSLISVNNTLTDLWSLFSIWKLTEVVRQKGDDEFIAMLNRIRVRQKTQPLSPEDTCYLQSKIMKRNSPDYPDNILHIAPLHRQLDKYNSMCMEQLSQTQTVFDIQAADIYHDKKNHRSYRRTEPLLMKNTSLPANVKLCVNARVMLTMNLDVADGLTNGAIGTVTAIIQGHKPLNQPAAVCILFDFEKIGKQSRKKASSPNTVHPRSTIITPQTEVIQSGTHSVTRHQYPFMLAWAVTIHKIQGLTTNRAVVSLKGVFKPGMAYVALSRVTSGAGLHLLDEDYDTDMIYCDPNVDSQLDKMPGANTLSHWQKISPQIISDTQKFLVLSHNCEGYFPHFHDIRNNSFVQRADIIALQETWTSPGDMLQPPTTRFQSIFSHRTVNQTSHFQGGGVCLFIHEDFDFIQIDTSTAHIECVGVLLTSQSISVLNVYRPPQVQLKHFCEELAVILSDLPTQRTVVLGDFNTHPSTQDLQETMNTYNQLITSPTTIRQTLIDHIYVKELTIVQSGIIPTYYSYHAMTYANIQMENNSGK